MVIHRGNYKEYPLGAKARNLFILAEQGFPVPDFFCITKETGREETGRYLEEHFPSSISFAVRSAARAEDGDKLSYAGQFATELRTPPSRCWEAARRIMDDTKRAGEYEKAVGGFSRPKSGPGAFEMDVIIQVMVEADVSGVLFTANPQGLLNESVIVAGTGSGENIVEDRIPVTTCYFNRTDRVFYREGKNAPGLDNGLLKRLAETGEHIEGVLGSFQDIEFAVADGQIHILQARPITTLSSAQSPVILDNSNIVESYPGITLPATQSFVRRVYRQVFKSCVYRLCRDKSALKERDAALKNMVDIANGRVYYRISNWYEVLTLLPFSGRIIPIWQEMLGVRERSVEYGSLKKPSFLLKCRVTVSFFHLLISCPRKMRELNKYFEAFLGRIDLNSCQDAEQLLSLYRQLEKSLSSRWDITLVNDMYTFLYTAFLKKAAGGERANQILSGVTGLESMKPVREMIRIASWVRTSGGRTLIEELKRLGTNQEAEALLEQHRELEHRVRAYISQYGDRYLEELKLESRTYRTDPVLLLRQIGEYAETGVKLQKTSSHLPLCGFTRFFAKRAALGIRNRELSRMNRSRIFGIVRDILMRIGAELHKNGLLEQERAIFYLYFEEIERAVRKKSAACRTLAPKRGCDSSHFPKRSCGSVQELIRRRKEEYAWFGTLPSYSRLVFQKKVWNRSRQGMENPYQPSSSFISGNGNETPRLYGTPCSGGTAEGLVLVVSKPSDAADAAGKILAAPMTDPGWAFLIAQAKALIVEKGSLLSHTAIVTRELRKPSVVGVPHAARLLKTGDRVRVNGTTGEIVVLGRENMEEILEENQGESHGSGWNGD